MSRFTALALSLFAPLAAGCAGATPPPRWAEGGATLEPPNARWVVGDDVVTVQPDGVVKRNGEFEMHLDRAGRVFDEDNEPVAVLQPDGHLVGTNDRDLGRVGSVTASLPGWDVAWIAVGSDGQVTHFGPSGERDAFGAWAGCGATPRMALACTLVTHLLTLRYQGAPERGSAVGVGVGVGVGFGAGTYGGGVWTAGPPGPLP